MKQYILSIFTLLVSSLGLSGQVCSIADTIAIKDLDTTYVSLIIDSAGNDDLSSAGQSLEAVYLTFRHLKLTDIRVNLISPAGQSINLMNPVLGNGPITQSKIWDITFLSSDFSVSPDKDFSNRWKNDNNWSGVNYYNGSYYPSIGHINNLNTGTVSGEWRLEIIDQIQASNDFNPVTGEPFSFFSYFALSFKDNNGIECGSCEPPSSQLTDSGSLVLCGDSTVDLDYQWDNTDSSYSIGYIMRNSTETYFSSGNTVSSNGRSPGSYTLCPIVYYASQEDRLVTAEYEDITEDIDDGILCARLSDDCIEVEILSTPEVITQERIICEGEEVTINGTVYNETGMYDITTPVGNYCDSLSVLDLVVNEIDVTLSASSTSISCNNTMVTISPEGLTGEMTWEWRTSQGGIIDDEDSDGVIMISTSGRYILKVTSNGCSEDVRIDIDAEDDFNTASIDAQDILCNGANARLELDFDGEISGSPTWTSLEANPFTLDGNDILTSSAGTYVVEVVNTSGCVFRDTASIVRDIVNISLKQGIQQQLSCIRESIDLEVQGMRPGDTYSFMWTRGGASVFNGNPFTVSAAGDYEVKVVNENTGCEHVRTINITDIRPVFELFVNATDITCNSSTASLDYLPINVPVITNERWLNMSGNEIATGSSTTVSNPGSYILELTSEDGCIHRDTVIVEDRTTPEELIFPEVVKNCRDNPTLLASPLTDYDFTWIEPDRTVRMEENPTAKFIGVYTFSATSLITGCVSTGEVNVVNGDNGLPNGIKLVPEDYTCKNAKPQIEVQLGGQVLSPDNYNYLWCCTGLSDGINTNTLTALGPGYYSVRVSIPSEPNCNNWYATKIEADTSSTIELSADVLSCVSDTASIRIPEEYQFSSINWIGPLPPTERTKREPTVSVSANYFVLYTLESNGCQGRDTVFVEEAKNQPRLRLDALSKDSIQCNDEVDISVLARLQGSLLTSVEWSGPGNIAAISDTLVTVDSAGQYLVIATGVGNCIDSLTVEIPADTIAPSSMLSKSNDIFCNQLEASIRLENTDNVSNLDWDESPNITNEFNNGIDVNSAGVYEVIITGDNKCITAGSIEIVDRREDPIFDLLPDTIITCDKRNIDIGITAETSDYNISWIGPDGPIEEDTYAINVASASMYQVEVTNDQECSVSLDINVTEDLEEPEYQVIVDDVIDCDRPEALVYVSNADPDWSYIWGDNVSIKDSTTYDIPGEYGVEVTYGRNGCKSSKSFSVDIDTTTLVIQELYGDSLACDALSYLHVRTNNDDGIRKYEWAGPDNYFAENSQPILLSGGEYTLSLTADNGCITVGSLEVSDDRLFPVLEVMDGYLRCDGNPTRFFIDTISPNSSILWQGESVDYYSEGYESTTNLDGVYIGIAENNAGCSITDTFRIIDEPFYPSFDVAADTFYCDGGRLYAIDIEDDESMRWKGPNGFLTQAPSPEIDELGVYTLVVTSIFGCQDSISVDLIDGRVFPDVSIQQQGAFQCNTEQLDLTTQVDNLPDNRLTYEWSEISGDIISDKSESAVTITSLGTYAVSVIDGISMCIGYDTLEVVPEEQSFQNSEYNLIQPTCESYNNGVIRIESLDSDYPPYTTYVNGYNYGLQKEINYLEPGTYYVRIVDSIGCEIMDTIMLEEPDKLVVSLPNDTIVRYGEVFTINGVTNLSASEIDSLLWTGITPMGDSLVQELLILENKEITLRVIDNNGCIGEADLKIYVEEPTIFFPNVFSPNGDGENDYFYLPYHPAFERVIDMRVYDNWGSLLYENKDVVLGDETTGWDGKYNGKLVEDGVYVVTFTGLLKGGEERAFAATVTVLK